MEKKGILERGKGKERREKGKCDYRETRQRRNSHKVLVTQSRVQPMDNPLVPSILYFSG